MIPFFLRRNKTPTPAPAKTITQAITIPAIAPPPNGFLALSMLFAPPLLALLLPFSPFPPCSGSGFSGSGSPGLSSQIAYKVVFDWTLIVVQTMISPFALKAQPLNCLLVGAVKVHSGKVYVPAY